MVFRLLGDPSEDCVEGPVQTCNPDDEDCVPRARCADPNEVKKRVYCTCRCNSGGTGFAECECPDGFSCVDVLEQGGPGVRGGYCVKNGTFNR